MLACDAVRNSGVFSPEATYCLAAVTPGAPEPQNTRASALESRTWVNMGLKSEVVVSYGSSTAIVTPYLGARATIALCPETE